MSDRPAWLSLLAPLPEGSEPTRGPVAPPDVLARPEGAAIAGWEQVVLHLSEPCVGLRTIIVLVDRSGTVLSASDAILYYLDGERRQACHESVGGSFRPDGEFLGTHWASSGPEPANDEPADLQSTPRPPTADEIVGLRMVVDEMLRRPSQRS